MVDETSLGDPLGRKSTMMDSSTEDHILGLYEQCHELEEVVPKGSTKVYRSGSCSRDGQEVVEATTGT